MRFMIFLYIWFSNLNSYSQNINVRLYSTTSISSFYFTASQGKYELISSNKLLCTLQEGESVTFSIKKNKILIDNEKDVIEVDSFIQIRGTQQSNYFTIISPTAKFKGHEYENDLYVNIKNNYLVLINDVNFDKYVAAVVEAEGGSKAPMEYYKAQSVLCRTYAAKFYEKHIEEGYNLCDGVHCQAYHGRCKKNPEILESAKATTGLIIVDSTLRIASATFYANSGGQTVNAGDLWKVNHYYLQSKLDPYSIGKPGYEWTKEIPLNNWKQYLSDKGFQVQDTISFNFEQPERKKYLNYNGNDSLLELKTIRTDYKLRSTYFSVQQKDASIVFQGKGYGHGVGLSQEGAMEMARQDFSYDKIIKFYFPGIQLMNMTNVKFFQIE